MKISLFALILIFLFPVSVLAENEIEAFNNTSNWTYPYTAAQERSSKISKEGVNIQTPLLYSDLVATLGNPDMVNDIHAGHFGLSPLEDGFMMANRNNLSYRAIWYVEKNAKNVRLSDKWLGAYIGSDKKTVMKILNNGL